MSKGLSIALEKMRKLSLQEKDLIENSVRNSFSKKDAKETNIFLSTL